MLCGSTAFTRRSRPRPRAEPSRRSGQLALFAIAENGAAAPAAPELAPLAERCPRRRCTDVRRLSYSALSLFERCSYRYFAERVVGMRPADAPGRLPGQTRAWRATEIGDAVHAPARARRPARALPCPRSAELVRAWYPAVTDEELERIRGLRRVVLRVRARARGSRRSTARPPSGRSRSSTTASCCTAASTCSTGTARTALVLDYKTNSLAEGTPEEIVEARLPAAAAGLRARLLPRRGGGGRGRLPLPRAARTRSYRRIVPASTIAGARGRSSSEAIARIQANEFRPTPDEFVCRDCPALDLVCAGPKPRVG